MNVSSECFLLDCIIKYKNTGYTNLRFPQFLYSELCEVKLDIAEKIVLTEYDFYYDEKLDSRKWSYVSSIWNGDEYVV